LEDDVQEGTQGWNLASSKKTNRDGWIDMAPWTLSKSN